MSFDPFKINPFEPKQRVQRDVEGAARSILRDDEAMKEKVKKEIDYSKMPEIVWQKVLKEFIDSMDNIEASLSALERNLKSIENAVNK